MTIDRKRTWLIPFLLALAVVLAPRLVNAAELKTEKLDAADYFTYEAWGDFASPLTADGDQVSDAANLVVKKVLAAYDTCADEVEFTDADGTVTVGDVEDGMALVFAHAECYWAGSEYKLSYYVSSGSREDQEAASIALSYIVNASEVDNVKKATEAKVDEALSWVDLNSMSDFEVAQALHDYLVRNCTYDNDAPDEAAIPARTAYGALALGDAVCQGYSLAYKLLLSRAGVPAVFVVSSSMNHSWNMVQVGGSWYHVDVTFDDPIYPDSVTGEYYDGGFDGEVSHKYFLLSDASMKTLEHDGWEAAYATPADDYSNRTYAVYKEPAAAALTDGWAQLGECEYQVDGTGCLVLRPLGGRGSATLTAKTPSNWVPETAASFKVEGAVKLTTTFRLKGKNLKSVDLSGLDFSGTSDISFMFYGCAALESVDFTGCDLLSVSDSSSLFSDCSSLTSVVLPAECGLKPVNGKSMFEKCSKLQSVDLSGLDLSGATSLASMFFLCPKLTSVALPATGPQVTTLANMFSGCSRLADLDLSGLDTSSVTNMSNMFYNCYSLESVSLGEKFSFNGKGERRLASLPAGDWRSSADDAVYAASEIPNNVAATYSTVQSLSSAKVEVADQEWTGAAVEPEVKVTLGDAGLEAGIDYSVAYAKNIEIGTATATVTGKGAYTGTASGTFAIAAADASAATIQVADQVWTGEALEPEVTVTFRGKVLADGADYDVAYTDNVNPGTATVAVTFKGNYAGAATGTFKITKEEPAAKTVTMHRLYNPYTGEHLYTASTGERDSLAALGWKYEGVGWTAPKESSTPVYRLYNPYVAGGDHHYTTSEEEYGKLAGAGWRQEGVAWYSDDDEGTPLYRQYNPYAATGTHNYTTSKAENDSLVKLGWRAEGVGWYGVK